jgi:2-keto-4-pentenoate hydratase/2-oxohepta-3-ene-1,7-dioic acid hydratase in catechol pathway
MRYAIATLPGDAAPRLVIAHGSQLFDARELAGARWSGVFPADLLELIRQGPDSWQHMAAAANEALARGTVTGHAFEQVRWHAPLPKLARNVFCLGQNYAAHAREAATARGREFKIPDVPIFFTKATTTITGPYDAVPRHRAITQQVDWEAELGVVIGVGGANIPASTALSHVFGYTVINDISARDVQVSHKQFFKGKSLDGFCPMGPVVVTADEFGDPQAKQIICRVNGIVKQHGSTAQMIFPVDSIIDWLSQGLTLMAGDIIATGTPEGVGLARTPPEFLEEDDVVETEVEGIGTMRNRIAAHD